MRNLVPPQAKVLLVHADTKPEKMLPAERLVSVLDAFLERHTNFVTFVVGTRNLHLDRGRYGKRVFPCYEVPLPISLALVGEANLFLGVDSCMLHAADLFKVPGVGLFGPTSCSEWGFRIGPHRHIYRGGYMDAINVDDVLDALESLITEINIRGTPMVGGNTSFQGTRQNEHH
jgi:ADP-heptose:LPS heptosyltransferase